MDRRRRVLIWTAAALALACLLTLPGAAAAQDLPPRPEPTATPEPTVTPEPEEHDGGEGPRPAPSGRITGTVIDLTTGAPAPGVAVTVGDATVSSDGNGNYDRGGLPADSYSVALALQSGQGSPAQGTLVVELAEGATVVQHLAFRSPAPAEPAPAGSQDEAQPQPAPAATPMPLPAALPATGARGGGWPGALGVIGLLCVGLGARLVAVTASGRER